MTRGQDLSECTSQALMAGPRVCVHMCRMCVWVLGSFGASASQGYPQGIGVHLKGRIIPGVPTLPGDRSTAVRRPGVCPGHEVGGLPVTVG